MTPIVVHADTHPYLADHAFLGTPVVPIAIVAEWFSAAADRPDNPLVLKDISVLRKMALTGFSHDGDRLQVIRRDTDAAQVLILQNEAGVPHFRTLLPSDRSPGQSLQWTVPQDLRPAKRTPYDGKFLFHGPAFHAVKRLHGVSLSGAVGVVIGGAELGWPGSAWQTDPAATDGGLQLAGLWAEDILGGPTLPMSIAEFRLHRRGLLTKPVRAFVRGRPVGSHSVECEIGLVGPGDTTVLELLGVRLVLVPEEAQKAQYSAN